MPSEARAHLRVHVPELKAEVGIDCQAHDSFWHLKLCLVNSLLASGHLANRSNDSRASNDLSIPKKQSRQQVVSTTWSRRHLAGHSKRPSSILNHLLSSASQSSASSSSAGRDSLTTRARDAILAVRRSRSAARCHSSIGSLSSADTSSCSAMLANYGQLSSDSGIHESSRPDPLRRSTSNRHNCDSISRSSTRYYGFNGFDPPSCVSDNARQSSDLTEDEEEVISALALSTPDTNLYDEVSVQDFNVEEGGDDDDVVDHDECRSDTKSRILVEHEDYGIYAKLTLDSCYKGQTNVSTSEDKSSSSASASNYNDHNSNGSDERNDFEELENRPLDTACNRLFEHMLKSGYLNYGASYYLDLEFKLKQRQQSSQTLPSIAYTTSLSSYGSCEGSGDGNFSIVGLNVISQKNSSEIVHPRTDSCQHSVVVNAYKAANRLSRLSFNSATLSSITKTNSSNSDLLSNQFIETKIVSQPNFSNNMIAKLASTGSQKSSLTQSNASVSFQSKRKRSKLLNLLLNTNWSKQSQQAGNLLKLNKILVVCDANFLDEKTGESPLSLAISSTQISLAAPNRSQANGLILSTPTTIGCPQSTSLFNLQSQSTVFHNQSTLQQTSITDICQSKAPLVERILLLLIKSGALIDFRNGDGRTPLHIAAMKSNFWALKTLLDLGASNDYRDINGLTPLYYSILHKAELKVTQLLLSHNDRPLSALNTPTKHLNSSKNIGITDQQGWQEVHQACKLGLDAHLDKLLYYGCDINARIEGSGNTPLHVAAINDQIHCAEILLLRGADRTITNNSHQTAHQVAVISNNMDLAEYIALHDETKVVLLNGRAPNSHLLSSSTSSNGDKSTGLSNSVSSHLVSSQSPASFSQSQSSYNLHRSARTGIVHPQVQTNIQQIGSMNPVNVPLTLDLQPHESTIATGNNSLTSSHLSSICGQGASLTVAANSHHPHQANVPMSNISPSLSQRSCALSINTATTSSSGVCCDGDANHSGEDLPHSRSQHSNITIISIGKQDLIQRSSNQNSFGHPISTVDNSATQVGTNAITAKGALVEEMLEGPADDDDDSRSGGSSSCGLQSLISEERPLYTGSIVEAISEYQSGDPIHLQLRRSDLIEVLDYPPEILQDGQLPRLANKPLVFGRRCSDGKQGLFPSFCVQRSKRKQSCLKQRNAMTDITNMNRDKLQQFQTATLEGHSSESNLSESRSIVGLNNQYPNIHSKNVKIDQASQKNLQFRQVQVALTKCNDGFGFVLRGAKVPPANLTSNHSGKVVIDTQILASNNLASLQYLDNIEPGSVAAKAGLTKGDFLVAVNGQDVRLFSHEQVVQLIRQSGDYVRLSISSPSSKHDENAPDRKALVRVKPEPPKRDPNTTLTRNKSHRIRSMPVAPLTQGQRSNEIFDADKPLPNVPIGTMASPTGSIGTLGRSVSTNLSQFQSINSLSSGVPDTQSISSISTAGSIDQHHQFQANPSQSVGHRASNHSSSSTATLTTVATKKPEAPAKPSEIHIKAAQLTFATSSNYQPAIITTNKRSTAQTSSTSPPDLPPPPPPLPNLPSLIGNAVSIKPNNDQKEQQVVVPPSSPPNPPPPPPLPDPPTQTNVDRLSQRRTSAPLNQTPLDSCRLLKKRESLIAINSISTKQSVSTGVPQMSEVAAACAAAANSRLLRQQQSADQDTDKSPLSSAIPTKAESIEQKSKHDDCGNIAGMSSSPQNSGEVNKGADVTSDVENQTENIKTGALNQPSLAAAQLTSSASLGRRASAQIIRQPKNNYASQSQTLRTKPKRPTIPNYEQPLPPPPLPPSDPSTPKVEQILHNYDRQQQIFLQQTDRTRSGSLSKRQSHEFILDHHRQQRQQNLSMSKQMQQQQQLVARQQQQQCLQEQQVRQHLRTHRATQGARSTQESHCCNALTARVQHNSSQQHNTIQSNQHHHYRHHHHHQQQYHHPNPNQNSRVYAQQGNPSPHYIYQPNPDLTVANLMQQQQTKTNGQHQGVSQNFNLRGASYQLAQENSDQHYNHCSTNNIRQESDCYNDSQSLPQARQEHQQQYNQQQLYQQMQRQQFIERYLPLVYSADSYAATMDR